MPRSDAASLLSHLFSHAHLEVSVPERPTLESSFGSTTSATRDVAFYDEVLCPRIRLALPSSTALPPPSRGHAAYPLPLAVDESEDDDLEERTEQARAIRLALFVLLSNIAIELRGSYVSSRPAQPSGSAFIPPTTAAIANNSWKVPPQQRPTPSLDPKDAAYLDASQAGDEVGFFSTAWSGNKAPTRNIPKDTAAARVKARRQRLEQQRSKDGPRDDTPPLSNSFATWNQQEERWVVEWLASIPVVFARHPSPRPALLLTASLSLRLSPSSSLLTALSSTLSGASPFLPFAASGGITSWADHDLLATLSSGPVYPDESPSQRAARAASALAKLPLSRLPSKVLATRLITPERSARDVGKKLSYNKAVPSIDDDSDDGEGDVTDGSSSSATTRTTSSSSSSRYSNSSGSTAATSDLAMFGRRSKELSEDGLVLTGRGQDTSDIKEGEATMTLQRSVRTALDVRSAVGVRMRTTIIENLDLTLLLRSQQQSKLEEDEEEDSSAASSGRTLVLCVEIDNPADSGLIFEVESCELDVTIPNAAPPGSTLRKPDSIYKAEAVRLDAATGHGGTGFRMTQGEQQNLLYFARFIIDAEASGVGSSAASPSILSPWPWSASAAASEVSNRNVAIVLHGKPLLITSDPENPLKAVTPDFSSTWNCTLDMQSLQEDLRRRTAASLAGPGFLDPTSAQLTAKTPASSVAGSMKHTASALAAAVEEDARRAAREQSMKRSTDSTVGRPVMERAASGLANAPLAGRFLRGGAAMSPAPSIYEEPSAMPSVLPGGGDSGKTTRRKVTGVGLLAQARLRAVSARIASGNLPEEELQTLQQDQQRQLSVRATPGDLAMSQQKAVQSKRLLTPLNGPRARVQSIAAIGSGQQGHPLQMQRSTSVADTVTPWPSESDRTAVLPFRLGRDSRWLEESGILVDTRVRNSEDEALSSDDSKNKMLSVEVAISNRSDEVKTFTLSWAKLEQNLSQDGDPAAEAPHLVRPDRSASIGSVSSFVAPGGKNRKDRLMDAETIKNRFHTHQAELHQFSSPKDSRLIIPLENHVLVGPILPGHADVVSLPLRCYASSLLEDSVGRYPLGDVILRDESTGQERLLKSVGWIAG